MSSLTEMNPNHLVQYLNKPCEEFTKADLIKYIEDHNIEMVNFRYTGDDGRLKTLNFVINSLQHLDNILSTGERVDGSSLFPFIQAGSSDLYVIPRYKTAFLNPFTKTPTLDILCSYYDKDGQPLASSPEYILRKAHETLKERTGLTFEVMGELEYYVISETEDLFQAADQKGYHEVFPFAKWEQLRTEAMKQQVSIVPGKIFSAGNNYSNCIRISFGKPWSKEVDEGLMLLGKMIKTMIH